MSRTNRLFQLMQYMRMQTPPVRASAIADELGISVRSVYRDIDTLRSSGAIIDGEAGFGYTLIEDPALPPMMFNRDQMEAIVLGLREVISVADPVLSDAAAHAMAKIKATLPPRMQQDFEHSTLHVKRFHPRPKITIDIAELREAMRNENKIEIDYSDFSDNKTTRTIKPLSIVYMDASLLLLAWCELRKGNRGFRMDRISRISVSDETFRPQRVTLLRDFQKQLKREAEQRNVNLQS